MEGHKGLSNLSALSTELSELEQAAVDKEIAHFRPLTLALPTIQDSAFKPIYQSRTITHGGRGHTLMADTWNTLATITHLLSFARYKTPDLPAEVRRFYTFGTGLNAHPGLLHGGVVSCILDSSMGGMAGIAVMEKPRLEGRENMFTVQLNVKFEKPVTTPGTVMVKAWVKSVDERGRKIWIEGMIVSGGRGEVVHARAEGMWLRVVAKL